MVNAKEKIDKSTVLGFLKKTFDKDIVNIQPINEGETSSVFQFTSGQKELIIRIGKNLDHFERDKFAFEHFASSDIPIPNVIAIGTFQENIFYAISEKINGNLFYTFEGEKFEQLLPSFIRTLDAIHATDISQYSGYGGWNHEGKANHLSWKACMRGIGDENRFHWQKIFKETCFEQETFDFLYNKLLSLLPYCPEGRYLIHGDFGVNNVLAKGDKITGVLDWGLSKYGDFLYDVAWIDFWPSQAPFGKIFFEHYNKKGINVENYKERILCYKLHFVIGSLLFFASSNRKEAYDYTRDRLMIQLDWTF